MNDLKHAQRSLLDRLNDNVGPAARERIVGTLEEVAAALPATLKAWPDRRAAGDATRILETVADGLEGDARWTDVVRVLYEEADDGIRGELVARLADALLPELTATDRLRVDIARHLFTAETEFLRKRHALALRGGDRAAAIAARLAEAEWTLCNELLDACLAASSDEAWEAELRTREQGLLLPGDVGAGWYLPDIVAAFANVLPERAVAERWLELAAGVLTRESARLMLIGAVLAEEGAPLSRVRFRYEHAAALEAVDLREFVSTPTRSIALFDALRREFEWPRIACLRTLFETLRLQHDLAESLPGGINGSLRLALLVPATAAPDDQRIARKLAHALLPDSAAEQLANLAPLLTEGSPRLIEQANELRRALASDGDEPIDAGTPSAAAIAARLARLAITAHAPLGCPAEARRSALLLDDGEEAEALAQAVSDRGDERLDDFVQQLDALRALDRLAVDIGAAGGELACHAANAVVRHGSAAGGDLRRTLLRLRLTDFDIPTAVAELLAGGTETTWFGADFAAELIQLVAREFAPDLAPRAEITDQPAPPEAPLLSEQFDTSAAPVAPVWARLATAEDAEGTLQAMIDEYRRTAIDGGDPIAAAHTVAATLTDEGPSASDLADQVRAMRPEADAEPVPAALAAALDRCLVDALTERLAGERLLETADELHEAAPQLAGRWNADTAALQAYAAWARTAGDALAQGRGWSVAALLPRQQVGSDAWRRARIVFEHLLRHRATSGEWILYFRRLAPLSRVVDHTGLCGQVRDWIDREGTTFSPDPGYDANWRTILAAILGKCVAEISLGDGDWIIHHALYRDIRDFDGWRTQVREFLPQLEEVLSAQFAPELHRYLKAAIEQVARVHAQGAGFHEQSGLTRFDGIFASLPGEPSIRSLWLADRIGRAVVQQASTPMPGDVQIAAIAGRTTPDSLTLRGGGERIEEFAEVLAQPAIAANGVARVDLWFDLSQALELFIRPEQAPSGTRLLEWFGREIFGGGDGLLREALQRAADLHAAEWDDEEPLVAALQTALEGVDRLARAAGQAQAHLLPPASAPSDVQWHTRQLLRDAIDWTLYGGSESPDGGCVRRVLASGLEAEPDNVEAQLVAIGGESIDQYVRNAVERVSNAIRSGVN
ncbi:MAG: hypothetical protein AAGE01_10230 [Pseudomonadota bacterium]